MSASESYKDGDGGMNCSKWACNCKPKEQQPAAENISTNMSVNMSESAPLEHCSICDEKDRRIAELLAEVREWICEKCNTIYPGPPSKGASCVLCPKCDGYTMPRPQAKIRDLERQLKEAKELKAKMIHKTLQIEMARRDLEQQVASLTDEKLALASQVRELGEKLSSSKEAIYYAFKLLAKTNPVSFQRALDANKTTFDELEKLIKNKC